MTELVVSEIGSQALFDSYVQHCLRTPGITGELPGSATCPITKKRE